MGKDLHHQESNLSIQAHNPGCMKGILHHFQNHKRLNVKKRLPYKKHSTGKHNTDEESSTKSTPETAEIGENSESVLKNSDVQVDIKVIEPSSARKSSMKSKIKALITDEMSKKRKGRHRRTASCPVKTQLDPANPIHHLEPSDLESPDKNHPNNEEHSRSNGSFDVYATALTTDYFKRSTGKLPVRHHTILQNEYAYAMEPSKYASLQESKLFLDALDLLNMRQEVFLKIVKDPSSSLAHQLQSRRNSKSRFRLTKSISFPAIRSAERRDSKLNESITKNCVDENEQQTNSTEQIEPSEDAPANMLRKRRDNKIALKRFKNITEKIKHVIKDKKKEKNMIVMDGVLHKIPYGRRASKDIKPDKADKFSKCAPKNNFTSDDCGKSFKRTSSFNDSIDKYDRLLEIGNSRETKDHNSEERIKFKTANTSPIYSPAVLERILSLPDLRSHSYYQIDDSSSTSALVESISLSTRRLREKKLSGVGSESKMQLCSLSESGSQENFEDVVDSFDNSTDLKTEENAAYNDLSFEPGQFSSPRPSKLEIILENEGDQQEEIIEMSMLEDESSSAIQQEPQDAKSCIDSVSTADTDTLETQIKQFYNDLFQDMKHKSEYNYVKDVLELSGFTHNEILGQWHSTNHPVDPTVFDEVEGCVVEQPGCPGNEEDGSCDHLLLFDLINEVLLSIYERSFCYWPMALTCQSRMHRMPKGYHVLEEVWGDISLFLSWRPENDQSIDDAVVKDLGKGDGWMNLQFDAECEGLELEDLIFDELLEEIISE